MSTFRTCCLGATSFCLWSSLAFLLWALVTLLRCRDVNRTWSQHTCTVLAVSPEAVLVDLKTPEYDAHFQVDRVPEDPQTWTPGETVACWTKAARPGAGTQSPPAVPLELVLRDPTTQNTTPLLVCVSVGVGLLGLGLSVFHYTWCQEQRTEKVSALALLPGRNDAHDLDELPEVIVVYASTDTLY